MNKSKKLLNIGVNARFLVKPYTGIGQYTRHLFWTLASQYPEINLVMVTPEAVDIDHPSNIEIVVLPECFTGSAGMKKTYWERVQLSQYFKKRKVDIVHHPYPALFAPTHHHSTVVTVHDDIPWTIPSYQGSLLSKLYQNAVRKKVRKADKIITVSKTSQHDIAQACGISPEKIKVIPIAPAPSFYQTSSQSNKILVRYNIPSTQPYLLYSGGYDVRKNVATLVKVFAEKIAPYYAINLVMVGGKALHQSLYDSFDKVVMFQKSLDQSKAKGRIITPGFIPEEDLPALYQHAYLFVNLSHKEGFNLTLLEAAVSGTPLLISDIPIHHEVIGTYAAYCSPRDEDNIAQALIELLENSEQRQRFKNKIIDYSCPFSWQNSAQKLYKEYEALIS